VVAPAPSEAAEQGRPRSRVSATAETAIVAGLTTKLWAGAMWVCSRQSNGVWTQQGRSGPAPAVARAKRAASVACPPTATPPHVARARTTSVVGRCGYSHAATACGHSKGRAGRQRRKTESPHKGGRVALSADGNTASWEGDRHHRCRCSVGVHPQQRRVDPARGKLCVWAPAGRERRTMLLGRASAELQSAAMRARHVDNNLGAAGVWIRPNATGNPPPTLPNSAPKARTFHPTSFQYHAERNLGHRQLRNLGDSSWLKARSSSVSGSPTPRRPCLLLVSTSSVLTPVVHLKPSSSPTSDLLPLPHPICRYIYFQLIPLLHLFLSLSVRLCSTS